MTFIQPDIPPLIPNLPAAQRGLQRQLARDFSTVQNNYSPTTVNAYLAFVRDRANRGLSPLSAKQSLGLLNAAETKQASTKPEQRDPLDLLGNIASDVGEVVQSIPKLPSALFHEVESIPQFSQQVAQAGGGIEGLLAAPVIRMIPGAYTARNLLTGNFNEIATHPVMTTLDVLPYAHAAGVGSMLSESKLGELARNATEAVGRTPIGRTISEAFHPLMRRAMAGEYQQVARVGLRSTPELATIYDQPLDRLAQSVTETKQHLDAVIPDPERMAAITNAMRTDSRQLDALDLNDAERVAVDRYMTATGRIESNWLAQQELFARPIGESQQPEILTTRQSRTLDRLTQRRDRWRAINMFNRAVRDPGAVTATDLFRAAEGVIGADVPAQQLMAASSRQSVAMGLVHSLDAMGYDTGALYDAARRVSAPKLPEFMQGVRDLIDNPVMRDNPIPRQRLDSVRNWMRDHRLFTDKATARMEESVARMENRLVPGRWQPTVEQSFNEQVNKAIATRPQAGVDPAADEALIRAVQERDYGYLLRQGAVDAREMVQWRREAVAAWQKARAEGANPVYVHNVSPGVERSLQGPPRITTIAPQPSQLRERTWDYTPSSDSLSVAITGQMREILRQDGARAYASWYENPDNGLVETRGNLEERLRPAARRMADRNNIPFSQALEDLVRKDSVPWAQAKQGFLTGKWGDFNYSNYMNQDELFTRRFLSDGLRRMGNPSAIERALNPLLKVFRTAVLPFSPRWNTNNILGGAIMASLEDPRIMTKLGEAFDHAQNLRAMNNALSKGADFELPAKTAEFVASLPESFRSTLQSLEYSNAPESLARYNLGRTWGRLANEFSRARGGLEKAAGFSYGINQLFDDMYRIASYLSGREGAFTKGMTREAAEEAGMALANKVMPRWNEMTPFERSILRPIIPFYPFLSHVFRYAWRFPVDHPWRTAVTASFARAEIEDLGTGLPQMFAAMIPISGLDSDGNQTMLDIGAANPFRGLGDDLTLAGFLTETNPVVRTGLQQIGFDPATKGPDLYPNIEYDPRTGQLRAKSASTTGLISQLVSNTVPQVQLLSALLGTNSAFNEMQRTNPDAAQRMLLSQAGIPLMWREVNIPQTIFKGELTRQRQQQEVMSAAMKTGDYSTARRFPDLVPFIDQLERLNSSGALSSYQPQPEQPAASVAGGSLTPQQMAISRAQTARGQ